MGDLASLSVWTALQCESGTNVGELAHVVSCIETWDVEQGWSIEVEIGNADPGAASVVKRRVLRVELTDGTTVHEYRIVDVSDTRSGRADVITIIGQDPRIDLAERVVLSTTGSGGVVYFDEGRVDLLPGEYIDEVVTQATAVSVDVSKGTITPTLPLTIRWERSTALTLVQQVVEALRARGVDCEFDYRRNGTTDYKIDLVTQIGSGATVPELHVGRHITSWKRTKTSRDQASRVIPFGGVDGTGYAATIARAGWEVTAKATNVLTLEDPAGGAGPVQFTSQHNDPEHGVWYLQATDGTLVATTASSRTSQTQSSVTVSSGTAFTVGDVVEIRANSSGKLISSLIHPTYIQAPPTGYGEKVVPLERGILRGERNLVPNPWMETWPSSPPTPPTGWTVTGGGTTTKETNANYVRFGSNGIRVVHVGGQSFFSIVSPTFPVFPAVGADQFTISCSLYVFTALSELLIEVITTPALPGASRFFLVPVTNIPLNGRWDLSIVGLTLPLATTDMQVRISTTNVLSLGAFGAYDIVLDAMQVTQTPLAADEFFVYPRANALWQSANEYLTDYGDPPADFEGNLLDYQRIDPTAWAAVQVVPGVTTRVVDDARSLDLNVRAVQIAWNRLVRGDTRIRWSTRRPSLVQSVGSSGNNALLSGGATPVPANSPGLGGGTTPPVPLVTQRPSVMVYPIHAKGDGTVTLASFPASETQRNQYHENFVNTAPYTYVRISARVTTALTGAEFVAKYRLTDGGTADYFDGIDGPVLALDTTGTVKGDDVALTTTAQGDVIPCLFERGGDGASSVVVGHVTLHFHNGAQLLNPVGCAMPGGIQYEGDLSAYADYDAFYTARGDDADGTGLLNVWYGPTTSDADNFLDTGNLFNGAPQWRGLLTSTASTLGWWTVLADSGGTPTKYDDITLFLLCELGSGFDIPGSTATNTGQTFMRLQTDTVSNKANAATLYIRDGNVFFEWFNRTGVGAVPGAGGSITVVDLGAVAGTWDGAKKQVLLRMDRVDASNFEVTVCLDDPCPSGAPTQVHQATYGTTSASVQIQNADWFNPTWESAGDGPTPDVIYGVWQFGYTDTASLYGL